MIRTALALALAASCSAFQAPGLAVGARGRPHASASLSSVRMGDGETQPKKKVVVTGVGAISAVGCGSDSFFQNAVAGKSGIARMPKWADEYPCNVAALVTEDTGWLGPEEYMDAKDARRQGRYTQFAMAASKMAVEDAKLDVTKISDKDRFGVLIGSGTGAAEFLEDNCHKFFAAGEGKGGLDAVSPLLIPNLVSNTAAGLVALEMGATGPNYGCVSACATGTHSIGDALHFLQTGQADVILAGGTESAVTPLAFAGFAAMRAMATDFNDDPLRASRPFDKDRAGFVMGEGGAVLCLETEEHALARGADIYCELAGFGASCDAHHITAPHPEGRGLSSAISQAIKTAGVDPDEIDYVNAHGTSTPYNDRFETMALKKALGDAAYKCKISSTKGVMGHTLAGAGGLEAAICAKVIKTGIVPPTVNLDNPDVEDGCDLDYTPHKSVKLDRVRAAISDNLGFGGHNAALVFKEHVKA